MTEPRDERDPYKRIRELLQLAQRTRQEDDAFCAEHRAFRGAAAQDHRTMSEDEQRFADLWGDTSRATR